MSNKSRLSILGLIFAPAICNAFQGDYIVPCHNQAQAPWQIAANIKKVVLIGTEDRQTYEEFASSQNQPVDQVEKALAASGEIECGGRIETAQVTGDLNVITTTGHTFHNQDCTLMSSSTLAKCEFRLAGHAPIKIKPETLKVGGCGWDSSTNDWGVVELESPAPSDVTPYLVPSAQQNFSAGNVLLSVSAGDTNFVKNGKVAKNVQACPIMGVDLGTAYPISTECDTGNGSSGAAQFLMGSNGLTLGKDPLVFAAMNVGESPAGVDGKPANYDSQFNVSIPVGGAFLNAINAAVAKY